MKFKKAMLILNKMCTATEDCSECPIGNLPAKMNVYDDDFISCVEILRDYPEESEEVMLDWWYRYGTLEEKKEECVNAN